MYKIIKDYSWHSFNKNIGFTRLIYAMPFLINLMSKIAYCFYVYFIFLLYLFNKFLKFYSNFLDIIYKDALGKRLGLLFENELREKSMLWSMWYLTYNEFQILFKNLYSFNLYLNFSANGYLGIELDDNDDFLLVQCFHHSSNLEYAYATFPTIIIIYILVPSLFLLYSLDENLDPKLTIKVVGHQWFWNYEYESYIENLSGEFILYNDSFDSVLIQDRDLQFGSKRLLEVDKRLILPINVTLRFVITSTDVLHSWSIPEMGIKVDAVPGRLNQFVSLINRPGIFYGQCSELCGVAHGFMPIVIHAIPYENFLIYLNDKQLNK
jgi:heme/copper-type cytochrome/quinol oxidase subunit 2